MRNIDEVIQLVQEHGERLTIPRRFVLETMCLSNHHLTIQDVARGINARHPQHNIGEATIYRIVQWLKDLGLVAQTDIAGQGVVYQLIDTPPHHHLICLRCRAVLLMDDEYFVGLRLRLQDEFAFRVRIDHMALYGLCETCQRDNTNVRW